MWTFAIPLAIVVLCIVAKTASAVAAHRREAIEAAAAEAEAAERRRREDHARREREAQAARRQAEAAHKRQEREAKQAAAHAAKIARATELAELAERRLAAERALAELRNQTPAEPAQDDAQDEPDAEEPVEAPKPRPQGNNAFKGETVSFTGKLPGMTRREAISAVEKNGGRAYADMPVGTTLLVVGDKPGMKKLDKADAWIGQVRKITAAQFLAMLSQPLTLEPEEFAAMINAENAA